jgi:hypothetical protein
MITGSDMVLTLFTNSPQCARNADAGGVDRVGLDLESIGKNLWQDSSKCWVSDHKIDQLGAVAQELSDAELFVRTNPIHTGSREEINACLDIGAQVLMLPMFHTAAEAAKFIELIDGRAKVSLLVETPTSAMRIHEIIRLQGIHEIHIGLNDMHLGMGLATHFEVLVSEFMDTLSKTIRDAGIPFGFCGVGRTADQGLPISPDSIYAQYARLGGTRALVSRVFTAPDPDQVDFKREIKLVRERLDHWGKQDSAKLDNAREDLRQRVAELRNAKMAASPV